MFVAAETAGTEAGDAGDGAGVVGGVRAVGAAADRHRLLPGLLWTLWRLSGAARHSCQAGRLGVLRRRFSGQYSVFLVTTPSLSFWSVLPRVFLDSTQYSLFLVNTPSFWSVLPLPVSTTGV